MRPWSGWILVAGLAVGIAGMVLGSEAETASCCSQPCQWILASECCDLSPAFSSPQPLKTPPTIVVGRVREVVAAEPLDVLPVGLATRAPGVPLGIRTTVLRL